MSDLLEKKNHYNYLYSFYGSTLTSKQQSIFESYYVYDLIQNNPVYVWGGEEDRELSGCRWNKIGMSWSLFKLVGGYMGVHYIILSTFECVWKFLW